MSYSAEFEIESSPGFDRIIKEELWKAAEKTRQAWQDNLQEGTGATGSHGRPYVGAGEAINRTNVYPELPEAFEYHVVGETIQHAIAEFGRTPGAKMPPHEPISMWAREAGLTPREGETWDEMVLNIRRHIAAHGLQGFAPGLLAFETIAPTVEQQIKTRFAQELED